MKQIFDALGVDPKKKDELNLAVGWKAYQLVQDNNFDVQIIHVKSGPKNLGELRKSVKRLEDCMIVCDPLGVFFVKNHDEHHATEMNNGGADTVADIIKGEELLQAKSERHYRQRLYQILLKMQNEADDFDNRGLFSSYYLKRHLLDKYNPDAGIVNRLPGGGVEKMLEVLGWKLKDGGFKDKTVSVITTNQRNFGIAEKGEVSPGMMADAAIKTSKWCILTNGKRWRLYSDNVSATSMNYLEIVLDKQTSVKYLAVLFGRASYTAKYPLIQKIFDESLAKATKARDDLTRELVEPKGIFLDIVKGVVNPGKNMYEDIILEEARDTAMKIMYRIWFVAYAESRDLLPIDDKKYEPISLQRIRRKLDTYENSGNKCWDDLLKLFNLISEGSPKHNLPQYNGDLFAYKKEIDGIFISNKYIVQALRGLLEKDGEAIDYADFGVRHLGNVFENLMSFSVKQARENINLVEEKGVFKEVKSKIEGALSFNKYELYLAAKGGIVSRKMSASYYTNEDMVKFLVWRGLEPILKKREVKLGTDVRRYVEHKTEENKRICIDRLTDIQILDPSMGSGHFLVEALNRMTDWCNNMLNKYPEHPMMEIIRSDRTEVIDEQKKKGVKIAEALLTQDVLLKRHIMKRCIFGVDIQPMAVELARLSLWLDSFAMGMPLTYMGHHLRCGDSTMGLFNEDFQKMEGSGHLMITPAPKSIEAMGEITDSADITVSQARDSEKAFEKYTKLTEEKRRALDALTASRIDKDFFSKKTPEAGKKAYIEVIAKNEGNAAKASRAAELKERHTFFHWEHEFGDAFTDARKGFDLIVGNPPWEVLKPSNNEFFSKYDIGFRKLPPKEKSERKAELLCDKKIKTAWDTYEETINEKNRFYTQMGNKGNTDLMPTSGDRDLWKLMLVKSMNMLTKNGVLSIVIPSSILSAKGVSNLRKAILKRDIRSMYVFENRKKIFSIHSSYRFVLLTVRNGNGDDNFPVGFYLHYLESLTNDNSEKEKFGCMSKKTILKSEDYIIPETVGNKLSALRILESHNTLNDGWNDGWSVNTCRGIEGSDDSIPFTTDKNGCVLYYGANIHQYMDDWESTSTVKRSIEVDGGLEMMKNKRCFNKQYNQIHKLPRLVYRKVASSTNMRACIATMIPPNTFYTDSLETVIPCYNDKIPLDENYTNQSLYMCGLFNSLVFDFVIRSKMQTNLPTIIKSTPIPPPSHKIEITRLAGKLVVGIPQFAKLARSMKIDNKKVTTKQRIEYDAKINALVADAYGLTEKEYQTVIDSFPAFKRNKNLVQTDSIKWDNNNIKEFYGEMAARSMQIFKAIQLKKERGSKKQ
ncbi:type II restriction enzyme, methylase subunit [Cenarchaeum symbiosum A]|uniref:site-specific DNA-methyltransferase (adenine-specific) n=1 Tax=Cenarchaeum symbiosum (strain A) TaxID=414004 RepID=A0RXR9_CENSY|nr:type II restriction enzyme, methylase subunit [Cenarchaeum symbiosum A]